jgi:malonate-semialdehyde dehydrogenase (acetylating)/methylmalonate-semialdehyde dehydrogenase
VYNPATGKVQARVLLAEPADVDEAVRVAKKAFESWQDVSLARRVRIMFAFRDLVERHLDDLARIVSAEHGKVVSDAKGEVIRGLEVVEFACGIPQLLKGEYSDQVSTDVDVYSLRQPLGVCAGITPFNFPAMVPMWMHPIAIATGNTFVLKPSERDPSASVLIAELYARWGLQRRAWRQGGRRCSARSFRGSGDLVRWLDPGRQLYTPARQRPGQAGAGTWRCQESRRGAA